MDISGGEVANRAGPLGRGLVRMEQDKERREKARLAYQRTLFLGLVQDSLVKYFLTMAK